MHAWSSRPWGVLPISTRDLLRRLLAASGRALGSSCDALESARIPVPTVRADHVPFGLVLAVLVDRNEISSPVALLLMRYWPARLFPPGAYTSLGSING